MAVIRISAPETAKPGEIIELKAMIQHPMETGYRRDQKGKIIPRDIITDFRCTYNDAVVFEAEFFPGTAANPFVSFFARAVQTGPIEFVWTDQHGQSWSERRVLTVS
ncbi:putative sulfur oxidation protein SoxZ [Hyphomonas neptunium ATCC 15444]|uniref:Putative sulfur oxidation protein SoxZ n=2 Tax=Hyphomonas TaxID=85 RepID=Q0BZC1_HYPNA|nr:MULTISPECIES: thiosulfate oxidation carrier complex protein SoxZ [Hyphomonas]ABI76936.1 putative sulfur oxidation protein SoxZ [Hyphomonas neptunium ATCC 15444]KCZ95261.1 putative sulfur oxidation protein SoxZ [Hyphomonas hirschiana VP5]